jgi:hypothetical protein
MDFAYTYQNGMDHKTPGTSGEDEVFDTCGTRLKSYEAMKLCIPTTGMASLLFNWNDFFFYEFLHRDVMKARHSLGINCTCHTLR